MPVPKGKYFSKISVVTPLILNYLDTISRLKINSKDNVLTSEDSHKLVLRFDLVVGKDLVGTSDRWCMGLSVLELSHARFFKKEPSDAERCPTGFHISFVQHDGAVIREDKLTHRRLHIIS